jgi:hypothetical protein
MRIYKALFGIFISGFVFLNLAFAQSKGKLEISQKQPVAVGGAICKVCYENKACQNYIYVGIDDNKVTISREYAQGQGVISSLGSPGPGVWTLPLTVKKQALLKVDDSFLLIKVVSDFGHVTINKVNEKDLSDYNFYGVNSGK